MLLPKMICPGGNIGRSIGLQVDVGLDLVRARSGTQRGYLTGRRWEGVVPSKDGTTKSGEVSRSGYQLSIAWPRLVTVKVFDQSIPGFRISTGF